MGCFAHRYVHLGKAYNAHRFDFVGQFTQREDIIRFQSVEIVFPVYYIHYSIAQYIGEQAIIYLAQLFIGVPHINWKFSCFSIQTQNVHQLWVTSQYFFFVFRIYDEHLFRRQAMEYTIIGIFTHIMCVNFRKPPWSRLFEIIRQAQSHCFDLRFAKRWSFP